jgi:hypothetical protein
MDETSSWLDDKWLTLYSIDLKSRCKNDGNVASGSSSAPSVFYWKIFPLVLSAARLPWTVTLTQMGSVVLWSLFSQNRNFFGFWEFRQHVEHWLCARIIYHIKSAEMHCLTQNRWSTIISAKLAAVWDLTFGSRTRMLELLNTHTQTRYSNPKNNWVTQLILNQWKIGGDHSYSTHSMKNWKWSLILNSLNEKTRHSNNQARKFRLAFWIRAIWYQRRSMCGTVPAHCS